MISVNLEGPQGPHAHAVYQLYSRILKRFCRKDHAVLKLLLSMDKRVSLGETPSLAFDIYRFLKNVRSCLRVLMRKVNLYSTISCV